MNKVCIIGVYFGKLPNYFPLWLKSCEYNPTIDFFIFGDQEAHDLPANVRMITTELAFIREAASDIVGFPVALTTPYKCCDVKPLYGLIFKDYVVKYEYWGHCDFDLVFGDLQFFFDKYGLTQFDKFLALGHLGLYRNTDEVNTRFKCTGTEHNYAQVYANERNVGFDELHGMANIYSTNHFSMFDKRIFADIATVYHRYRIIDEYPPDIKAINYPLQTFFWEKGKTYRAFVEDDSIKTEEYIYIHFQKRPNYELPFDPDKYQRILLTNKGFVPLNRAITREDMKKYNPFYGKLYERAERSLWIAKRGIKRRLAKFTR